MPLVIPPSMLSTASTSASTSRASPANNTATKVACTVLTTYCAAWGVYYLVQDSIRRTVIAKRKRRYRRRVARERSGAKADSDSHLDSHSHSHSHSHTDLDSPSAITDLDTRRSAVSERFAPLSVLGRYVNPFSEWREQGAWEFVLWKSYYVLTTGRLWYDGGIGRLKSTLQGRATIAKTLPLSSPDWRAYPSPNTPSEDSHLEDTVLISKSDLGDNSSTTATPPPPSPRLAYTWIGQSTFLVSYGGLTLLTDPVFGVQPVPSIFSPTRITDIPCSVQDILANVRLDVVLITHNHYDHFDADVVPHVPENVTWIVPLGMRGLLKKSGVKRDDSIVELTWWEMRDFEFAQAPQLKLSIQAVPALHWSARTPLDTNQSLWNSYSLTLSPSSGAPPASLYFSGDTGYSATYYPLLGASLPRGPDLAFLPIGSYRPTWHMSPQHCSPHGAVRIARDLAAKKVVGMHWGTWIMSDEEWDEPPKVLREALGRLRSEEQEQRGSGSGSEKSRDEDWFTTVNLGETNHLAITGA